MENCIANKNINNDFLSQSYSQGIERYVNMYIFLIYVYYLLLFLTSIVDDPRRITGTKDNIFNFQIPEELLEVREKNWDNLFDKYSKEVFPSLSNAFINQANRNLPMNGCTFCARIFCTMIFFI